MTECVLAFGEAALPVRFEDDQPPETRHCLDSPAAPGRPFAFCAGPPAAGERSAFFGELEAAAARDFRLAVAEFERIAAHCALDARCAAALVEAVDAPLVRNQPDAAEISFPDSVPAAHRDPGWLLVGEEVDQCGVVPAPRAARVQLAVELLDDRRQRQRRAVFLRFGERDVEVLAHPVDRKAEALE